ncbi:SusC/RagA family TonB-linked outer membrane protein [Flavobacterium pectinovorum]|uniref:SusC/RagA family TonB-linked outer membrane protein n=1 Tax=Flavobacterium pectinovorum TaxID=29533 RepID=UPI001FAB5568|nr:SusC/RagA family TonB-linked outer membrane protein [Flavobacterium pectinovorum]MCI9843590.1 SusC/RagA family TonB-linked outer membrane protein [Flavobacterium pectinovorum]
MKFIYLPILEAKIVKDPFVSRLRKLFLALFLFLSFHGINAQSNTGINLNFKDKPLPAILKAIKKQSGYVFISGDVDLNKYYLTVQLKNATIEEVLSYCLVLQGLEYKIVNKTVVISKGGNKGTKIESNSKTLPIVTGQVVRPDGSPFQGASVAIKDTYTGAITDESGFFLLNDVPVNAKIVISFIGFADKEIAVSGRAEIPQVRLEEEVSELDEIKVLAYGITTSKRFATGNSVKITSKDIEKQPVGNVMQALQGRVAGMVITQTSGLHGADVNVAVRGQNSIFNDTNEINAKNNTNVLKSTPLYIVDGIAFPAGGINQLASSRDANGDYNYITGPNGNGSPLSTINPRDIESIEVLKDANATALYGSRGANGVILITTKKGKVGKPTISVDLNSGVGIVNTKMKALGLNDYLALRRQAFANDNRTPTTSNAPDLTLWSQTESKDFKKQLVGDPSRTYTGNLSVSGGNNGMTFMLSGNLSSTGSVFDDNRLSKNYGFHFSSGYVSPDQKFTANISMTMGSGVSNLASAGFYTNAYSLPPNFPLYNPDGSLYWYTQGIPNIANPLSVLNNSYENKMNSNNTSLNLKYNINPDLNISVNTGFNRSQSSQSVLTPNSAGDPNNPNFFSQATYSESVNKNFVFEPQINYNKTLRNSSLSALLGGTYQQTSSEQPFYIEASGFASDLYLSNLSLATNYKVRNGDNSYKYVSIFGNINYIFKEKYIVNGNFRRDGSSKFGSNNLFSNFGSVGAAWIFTSEKFFSWKPQWFSFGKIRSSYGVVGSDNIENYSYLATYSSSSASNYYSGVKGLVPTRLANPDYKWELSRKFELAADFGFLNDRLLLDVSYYRNRTGNQLVDYPLPMQTGFSSYTQNLDAIVENTGWEITLSTINFQTDKFRWSTSGNISFVSNKLLSFPGLENSPYAYSYVVGKPVGALNLLHYTGNDANGRPTFEDVDKDGVITPALGTNTKVGDLVYKGTSAPDFYGGLVNSLKYGDVQLDFNFTFTVGAKSLGIVSQLQGPPGNLANYPTAVLQEMRELGLEKLYSTRSFSTDFDRLKSSDAFLQTKSYARLTNVSLSYNFPDTLARRMKLAGMRAYLQGQNLLLINFSGKAYAGIDPETGLGAVPPLQVFVCGLQFSF